MQVFFGVGGTVFQEDAVGEDAFCKQVFVHSLGLAYWFVAAFSSGDYYECVWVFCQVGGCGVQA